MSVVKAAIWVVGPKHYESETRVTDSVTPHPLSETRRQKGGDKKGLDEITGRDQLPS